MPELTAQPLPATGDVANGQPRRCPGATQMCYGNASSRRIAGPNRRMNLLVVVVDRLHIGYLGCYGNSWVGTPGIDALAAGALVFDHAIVDTTRLESLYETYWSGVNALASAKGEEPGTTSLPKLLRDADWQTALVTDEPLVAHHRLAAGFEKRHLFTGRGAARRTEQGTSLELLFAEAGRQLADRERPFCLWIHSRGFGDAWDAPLARRRQYAEEEDPFPPDFRDVPQLEVPADFDPDQLQGIRWAYAGQVTLLDDCLAALTELLVEMGHAADTAVVLLGARGFPLGEHGWVGARPPLPHEELIHAPWIMRLPDEEVAGSRTAALVQPDDLAPTLLAVARLDPQVLQPTGHNLLPLARGEVQTVRDRAVTISESDEGGEHAGLALRTAHWHLRAPLGPGGDAPVELYVKPDDRWELNEIASRCPAEAEQLREALAQLASQPRTEPASLSPLPQAY